MLKLNTDVKPLCSGYSSSNIKSSKLGIMHIFMNLYTNKFYDRESKFQTKLCLFHSLFTCTNACPNYKTIVTPLPVSKKNFRPNGQIFVIIQFQKKLQKSNYFRISKTWTLNFYTRLLATSLLYLKIYPKK